MTAIDGGLWAVLMALVAALLTRIPAKLSVMAVVLYDHANFDSFGKWL